MDNNNYYLFFFRESILKQFGLMKKGQIMIQLIMGNSCGLGVEKFLDFWNCNTGNFYDRMLTCKTGMKFVNFGEACIR